MTFYFAWSPPDTPFGAEHEVMDEEVAGFRVDHLEGGFAGLEITIRNPRIGLLNDGREVWTWLSMTDESTDGVLPLFYGRLVGVPENLQADAVTLTFLARPTDWDAQRAALAETLKVRPYWDPVFVVPDMRDDPDTALEARDQLWHIDRTSHVVTVSSIIAGEDGTINFTIADYDSVQVTLGQPPLRKVRVEASVSWDQYGQGSVDLRDTLLDAAIAQGSSRNRQIASYTGVGLIEDWPEKSDRIGGGWTVGESRATRTDGTRGPFTFRFQEISFLNSTRYNFPLVTVDPVFSVDYEVTRGREERLSFDLEADVQALLTEAGEEEVLLVTASSEDVQMPVDPATTDEPDGALPIGDLRRRAYFPTDRGRESVDYLLAYARARLLARARAVDVTFTVPFSVAVGLSCRMSGQLTDPRLPGGQAIGKIIAYSFSANGDGEKTGSVTLGCTIGKGGAVSDSPGTPDYVDDGYVENGWQTRTGQDIQPIDDLTYEDFSGVVPNDDGLDLFNMTPDHVVESVDFISPADDQRAVLLAYAREDVDEAIEALKQVPTEIDLLLRTIKGGPFLTDYPLTVSQLMVPNTIDLEAAAV